MSGRADQGYIDLHCDVNVILDHMNLFNMASCNNFYLQSFDNIYIEQLYVYVSLQIDLSLKKYSCFADGEDSPFRPLLDAYNSR